MTPALCAEIVKWLINRRHITAILFLINCALEPCVLNLLTIAPVHLSS